jgi:hypothetical protein
MPGVDYGLPQPIFNATFFNRWLSEGGMNVVGVPFNPGAGPGVHWWGPGVTQDFVGGDGIIMQKNATGPAYWVHGAIRQAYVWTFGGATGPLGYPTSSEVFWGGSPGGRRQWFEGGIICWSPTVAAHLC